MLELHVSSTPYLVRRGYGCVSRNIKFRTLSLGVRTQGLVIPLLLRVSSGLCGFFELLFCRIASADLMDCQ